MGRGAGGPAHAGHSMLRHRVLLPDQMGLFGAFDICSWRATLRAPDTGSSKGVGKHTSTFSTLFCAIKPVHVDLTIERGKSCSLTAKWSLLQDLKHKCMESRMGDSNEAYVSAGMKHICDALVSGRWNSTDICEKIAYYVETLQLELGKSHRGSAITCSVSV